MPGRASLIPLLEREVPLMGRSVFVLRSSQEEQGELGRKKRSLAKAVSSSRPANF